MNLKAHQDELEMGKIIDLSIYLISLLYNSATMQNMIESDLHMLRHKCFLTEEWPQYQISQMNINYYRQTL